MKEMRQKLFDELLATPEDRVSEWFENYNHFTKDIQEIRERLQLKAGKLSDYRLYAGLESLSDQSFEGFVWKLVGELLNGIASRGQSVISREHLAQFREAPQFEKFLREIIVNPLNNELFFRFNEWWVNQPSVKHNRVLINRIFAACAPAELSTVVDEGKFNRLFAWLQSEQIIAKYEPPHSGDSWLSRNIFLMKELYNIDRGGLPEGWLSLFPWLLFEYMEHQQNKMSIQQGKALSTSIKSMPFSMDAFSTALDGAGLAVNASLPTMVCSALHAKPFLILTGLSGSGKTQLAQALSKWITGRRGVRNPFLKGMEVNAARSIYTVLDVDRLGVKVGQSGSSSNTFLPFDLVEKWVESIKENGFDLATPSQEIQRKVIETGLEYSPTLNSFHAPLKALACHWIENATLEKIESKYELISVGADWTSNENLLGYPDALNPGHYRKPDNGALDLILRAQADPEHPYFLILDEMNLSHVERYFADFLSAMESGEAISLHDDTGEDWNGVPAKLKIPKNLFVIGTVNVDETTYMFSPKVLDRANVIEFRVSDDEMKSFLENPVKPNLKELEGQGAQYAKAFVAAAKQKDVPLDDATREAVSKVLMEFFPQLKEAGAEFGYRTAHEICRLVYFHKELSSKDWKMESAMDAAIMQKLLPKLHGSKKKLGPVLAALIRLCLKEDARPENDPIKDEVLVAENALYPGSLEKLARMRRRLAEHGFTSFAEA